MATSRRTNATVAGALIALAGITFVVLVASPSSSSIALRFDQAPPRIETLPAEVASNARRSPILESALESSSAVDVDAGLANCKLLLRTLDGMPAVGVVCDLHPAGERSSLRQTSDASGALVFPRDVAGAGTIALSSPRFGRKHVTLPQEPPPITTVYVHEAGSIEGRVLLPGGEPATSGRVLVWPINRLTSQQLRQGGTAARGLRDLYSAHVDENGLFQLAGLEIDRYYGVTAYGDGYLVDSEREVRGVRPPQRGLEVHAEFAYAVRVALQVDPSLGAVNGALVSLDTPRPRASQHAYFTPIWAPYLRVQSAASPSSRRLSDFHWGSALVGLEPAARSSELEQLVLLISPQRVDALELQVRTRLIGCEDVDAIVSAPPFNGTVPLHTIAVPRPTEPLGELLVTCDVERGPEIHAGGPSAPCLVLELSRTDRSDTVPIHASLDWGCFSEWRVGGLPVGTYTALVRAPHGGWSHVFPEPVHVVALPVSTRLAIPRDSCGLLVVRCTTARGEPYTGHLDLLLMQWSDRPDGPRCLTSSRSQDVVFASSPYVLPFVRPAQWVVKTTNVLTVGSTRNEYASVRVEPSGRHVCELVLDCVD